VWSPPFHNEPTLKFVGCATKINKPSSLSSEGRIASFRQNVGGETHTVGHGATARNGRIFKIISSPIRSSFEVPRCGTLHDIVVVSTNDQ